MLETLGNIGDFLGGIGVVVTLLYLATQIRQNTMSIRMSAFLEAQRDVAAKLDGLSTDPELIRIYFDGNRDFESFSKEDRRRYGAFMAGLFRRYETLLYQTRLGNIDPSQWEGILTELRTIFRYPGAKAWWSAGQYSFNRELRDFLNHEVLQAKPRDPAAQQAAEADGRGLPSRERLCSARPW